MANSNDWANNGQPAAGSEPVSQRRLLEIVLPLIESGKQHYKKFQRVRARPAVPGETIVTETADGKETSNTAEPGAMVVRNLTAAREEYIVPGDKFTTLYESIERGDDEWALYRPLGEILALEISTALIERLGVKPDFQIMAPWGSTQKARRGDLLVTPLPGRSEVYRISLQEFTETYRRKE